MRYNLGGHFPILCGVIGCVLLASGLIRQSAVSASQTYSSIQQQVRLDVGSVDSFSYPAMPGTNEWLELGSTEARREASQIPSHMVEGMSTKGLIQNSLDYPFKLAMHVNDYPQHGFDVVRGKFNGLEELLTRDDVGSEVLSVYASTEIIPNFGSEAENVEYAVNITELEMLVAQQEVLDSLDREMRQELLQIAYNNLSTKLELGTTVYTNRQTMATALIAGRIMYTDTDSFRTQADQNEQIMTFLETGMVMSADYDEFNMLYEQLEQEVDTNASPTSISMNDINASSLTNWMLIIVGTVLLVVSFATITSQMSPSKES